ncbi:MAG: DUF4338 domain-containing protein [Anaerolineae bacterium]|nr:DUF4338 domain-containing protein [Anaerolineae bacterium]
MQRHYSRPKGFVGRSICHAVYWNDDYYGHIVGGSATRYLPGRHEFLGTDGSDLNQIINNVYYHVEKVNEQYPCRNFTSRVLEAWAEIIAHQWQDKYGASIVGFESLIELPRSGETYRRAGWTEVGTTKGYTCKRTAGKGTDSWSGKRVWDTNNLRPKRVFCKLHAASPYSGHV